MPTFDTYRAQARRYEVIPHTPVLYALGLVAEAGELYALATNTLNNPARGLHSRERTSIRDEIGDIVWYADGLAAALGIGLGFYPLSFMLRADAEDAMVFAAQLAGLVYKATRDDGDAFDDTRTLAIRRTLERLMTALAEVARRADLAWHDILQANLDKLARRAANDTINGDGDDR